MHSLLQRVFLALLLTLSHAALAQDRTLLVFGDSLSSAYRMDESEGWPALLEKRMHQSGFDIDVVNASRNGETSDAGRRRLGPALESIRPAFVILALGANDGLRQRPIGALKHNLIRMVAMVRERGGTPVLVGMKLPPTFDRRYAEEFAGAFAEVASKTNTPFVPFLLQEIAGNPDLFMADKLHPSAEAQPKLLDVVWPVLNAVLISSHTVSLATRK